MRGGVGDRITIGKQPARMQCPFMQGCRPFRNEERGVAAPFYEKDLKIPRSSWNEVPNLGHNTEVRFDLR